MGEGFDSLRDGFEGRVVSVLRSYRTYAEDHNRRPGAVEPGFIIRYTRAREVGTATLERYGVDGPGDMGSGYARLIRPDLPMPGGNSSLPDKVTA